MGQLAPPGTVFGHVLHSLARHFKGVSQVTTAQQYVICQCKIVLIEGTQHVEFIRTGGSRAQRSERHSRHRYGLGYLRRRRRIGWLRVVILPHLRDVNRQRG